ncbi:MAG: acetylxylan esterase [Planctomycetota bacterium]
MSAPRTFYPGPDEVDEFCEEVFHRAEEAGLEAEFPGAETWPFRLGVRHTAGRYVAFDSCDLGAFYGFWQPSPSGRGPLLVHLPGYGAEMSAHPELVSRGYSVLHVNPLGYATPEGPDESKRPGGTWPVLPETVRSLGRTGYRDWLAQAAAATLWARRRDGVEADRYAFFGTSQGGGGALLLGSVFHDHGVRAVAADLPFLTNFPTVWQMEGRGAYETAFSAMHRIAGEEPDDLPAAWRAVGLIDTTAHAHRLTMPVLLTAGGEDPTCPAETVRDLFRRLPATRSYTELAGQGHAYTTPFLHLARAWFRLYV